MVIVRGPFVHDARVLRAARTLRELGHHPVVVAARTADELPRRQEIDGLPVVRVDRHRLIARLQRRDAAAAAAPADPSASSAGPARQAALRAYRLLRTVDYYARATRVVLRERPRLMHCNDYPTMWVGVVAKLLCGTRVIYDSHELWPDRNGRFEWRPWLVASEAVFTRVADRVVAASPGYADEMRRRYRIERPAVVRNAPDPPNGPLASEPDGTAGPVAVYVGVLTSARGLEQAIDATALVPGLRLRLLGPGRPEMLDLLRRRAAAAGIEDRVEIPGPVPPDEVVSALAGATLGLSLFQPICLSYELTMPNKLLEYVAAGVPVVSSDIPVSAAFVRAHGIGVVVPAADSAAIAEGMRRLLDPEVNAAVRRRIAELAPQVTWEQESARLKAVYAQVTPA